LLQVVRETGLLRRFDGSFAVYERLQTVEQLVIYGLQVFELLVHLRLIFF
jgi:hypothetical protein